MKIFLSAVSGQFKACRDALRSDLSAVGAKVVVQEDFQQHGASLLEKLERYIASCDRIIALVGDAYGFEPEETARPDRTTAPFLYPMGVLVRHGRATRRVTPTAQGHLSLLRFTGIPRDAPGLAGG